MKYLHGYVFAGGYLSLPVRGAWVEIFWKFSMIADADRRSPCGERGLKSKTWDRTILLIKCRSPCGERGLK